MLALVPYLPFDFPPPPLNLLLLQYQPGAKLQFMVWAPWAPKGAGLPGLHMVLGS